MLFPFPSTQESILFPQFLEKRKELKGRGYGDKELADSYAFCCVDSLAEARTLCERGFSVHNVRTSCLGNPELGTFPARFSFD